MIVFIETGLKFCSSENLIALTLFMYSYLRLDQIFDNKSRLMPPGMDGHYFIILFGDKLRYLLMRYLKLLNKCSTQTSPHCDFRPVIKCTCIIITCINIIYYIQHMQYSYITLNT